jgi:hypothetical protein
MGPGIALGFGVGVGIALFSHYGWGYSAWAPNWRGGVVVYNHATYISRSVTVINRGNFGAYNRGVFERPGPGVPAGAFRPAVTAQTAVFAHPAAGGAGRPAAVEANRPAVQANRPPAPAARGEAPQAARPPAKPAAKPAPKPPAKPAAKPEPREK